MKDVAAFNKNAKYKFSLLILSAVSLGFASPASAALPAGIPASVAGKVQTQAAKSAEFSGPAQQQQEAYVEAPSGTRKPVVSLIPPSVPYWNGWASGSLGGMKADSLRSGWNVRLEGGTAFFLPRNLGGEINLQVGSLAHHNFFDGDGLVFWRKPSQALLAAHYQYVGYNETYSNLYGLRGDAYIDAWTVSVEGGSAHTNIYGGRGYVDIGALYYLDPNWYVGGNYFITHGSYAFQAETEYQFGLPSWPGLTLFANLGGGNNGLRYGNAGLRYYFACDKPLQRRQREDMVDPNRALIFKEALPGVKGAFG